MTYSGGKSNSVLKYKFSYTILNYFSKNTLVIVVFSNTTQGISCFLTIDV